MRLRAGWTSLLAAALLLSLGVRRLSAATVTVVNEDGAGEGFNDPTPVAPVGGNAGVTLGAQRLSAFEYAASIWGAVLRSDVEIRIAASFDPLLCSSASALLGSAGPETVHRDFTNAPRPATWYPQALANALAGVDLDPSTDDVFAQFSSVLGTTCAFPRSWYYGFDGAPGADQIDLVTVILHEVAHGLGFISLVGLSNGHPFLGFDDAYMLDLEDHSTGELFADMTDGERLSASTDSGDLHWVGAGVVSSASGLSSGRDAVSGHVEMYAPDPAESGSSVSHFSTSLSPNELMEPFYTAADHDVSLTAQLLFDIGWLSSACGNGILDTGEQCDDGNAVGGDGCTGCRVDFCYACAGEPSACAPDDGAPCDDGNACTSSDQCAGGVCAGAPDTGTACDDGNPCTHGDQCVAGACVADSVPLTSCGQSTVAGKGLLLLKDRTPSSKDKLVWKWLKGEATQASLDFGDPTTATDYLLCIYDKPSGTDRVILGDDIPAGAGWRSFGAGFKFKDRNKSPSPAGITLVLLKEGQAGKAKIIVKGRGANLGMPDLTDLHLPLTVQLSQGTTCWQATFGSNVLKSDARRFKARAD